MLLTRRNVLRAAAGATVASAGATSAGQAQAAFAVPRQILAWYYPWFSVSKNGQIGAHWGNISSAQQACSGSLYWPSLAPYNSDAAATIDRHFAWMQQCAITGVVVSWWGAGNLTDLAVPLLLDAAAKYGLHVTFEIPQLRGSTPAAIMTYLVGNYGAHPRLLRVNGQPVMFINGLAWSTGGQSNGWDAAVAATARATGSTPFLVADLLGGHGWAPAPLLSGAVPAVYKYSTHVDFAASTGVTTLAEIQSKAPGYYAAQVAAVGNAVSSCIVLPRHNGTRVHSGVGGYVVDGYGGETMRTLLGAAIAADPDWIIVVSWNEWGEGSMLEPSRQFGSDSFHPQMAQSFLAKSAKLH